MAKQRSDEQKRLAIERLVYEIRMLCGTAVSLSTNSGCAQPKVCHNSHVHSFLLAVRNLLHFFFPKGKKKNQIDAGDFVESWKCNEPDFQKEVHWRKMEPDKKSPRVSSFREILSQRLHHITWPRVEESQLDWVEQAITREFLEPIERFRDDLPQELCSDSFVACVSELRDACKRFEPQQ